MIGSSGRAMAVIAVIGLAIAPAAGQAPSTISPTRTVIADSSSGIPDRLPPVSVTAMPISSEAPKLPKSSIDGKAYPITLGAALKLAGARPVDIQLADQHVAIAGKQLERAQLLWVPSISTGLDYFRHEGGQQNFAGDIVRSSRGNFAVGVGPNAVVPLTDALYAPLSARQDLKARHAIRQAVENDATFAVAESYFFVQQAKGELAGAMLALKHAEEVSAKATKLAEGLAPPLEASRAKVELARRQQGVAQANERWRTASAELVRLLRLEPGVLVDPMEASFSPVTIIDPNASLDSLLVIATSTRPELAGHQALVKASAARVDQERYRPLLPTVSLRSTATNPSGSIAWGGFGGGPNDRTQSFGSRFDMDLQVMWEFQSLGLGNKARVGERLAEQQAATLELVKMQDRVQAEVTASLAQLKAAAERATQAEPALKEAVSLVEKSLEGLGQTKRVGDTLVLIVRPQEVVAAVQLLAQANADYYGSIGDYNRAQFRLYRALGHPGQALSGSIGTPAVEQNATKAPTSEARLPRAMPAAKGEIQVANFSIPAPPPPPVEPRELPICRAMLASAERILVPSLPESIPAQLPTPIAADSAWQAPGTSTAPTTPAAPSTPQAQGLEWGAPKDKR